MIKSRKDEFLSKINTLFQMNDSLTSKEIYSLLVYHESPGNDITHFFPKWIKYFENQNNLDVFVDPNRSYFCQFTNGSIDYDKCIKLYIPLKGDHIEDGAKKIFTFLKNNRIFHESKIGSHLRNDNLVIRVNSMNDANKIINFVKSNQFLQDGLLDVNPFVFNQNGIGITMDGAYSYNKELSNLLCTFLSLRKEKNIVSAPTTLEFANFVLNVINNTNDQDLLKIYNFIYTNLTKDNLSLNDFYELVNHYQGNKELLIKALQTTKQKYGD